MYFSSFRPLQIRPHWIRFPTTKISRICPNYNKNGNPISVHWRVLYYRGFCNFLSCLLEFQYPWWPWVAQGILVQDTPLFSPIYHSIYETNAACILTGLTGKHRLWHTLNPLHYVSNGSFCPMQWMMHSASFA